MPRMPRVHLENVVYFVSLEGPHREAIFRDEFDYNKYLELLGETKTEYGFKLFSYTLLPGSLSLLIEATEEFNISQIMQRITPLYTKYYNSRYRRKGSLFQKRFRSVIVQKEQYLSRLTRYLHIMPLEAKVSTSAAAYVYSSAKNYGLTTTEQLYAPNEANMVATSVGVKIDMATEVAEVAGMIPGGCPYDAYVSAAHPVEYEYMDKKISRGNFLGSRAFTNGVKRKMKEQLEEQKPEVVIQEVKVPVPAVSHSRPRLVALSSMLALSIVVSVFAVRINQDIKSAGNAVFMIGGQEILVDLNQPLRQQSPTAVTKNFVYEIPKEPKSLMNGATWEIELLSVNELGERIPIKDKIHFTGTSFKSYHFARQGFQESNYSVDVHDNGVITWETIQQNEKGESVTWRGDWNGKNMHGMLSVKSTDTTPQNMQFLTSPAGGSK